MKQRFLKRKKAKNPKNQMISYFRSGSAGSRSQYDSSSGSSSKDNKFKGYVPTEVRAKKGGWNFFNGGGEELDCF